MRAPAGRTARAHTTLSPLSLTSLSLDVHYSLYSSNNTRTAEHVEHHARALDRRRVLKANYQF